VTRGRLLDDLDRLAATPLTLVDAPVGFGKSVLVETWAARSSGAVAWVSLDAGDSDPARLWTYVATAVDRVRPGLGRAALGLLRSPGASFPGVVDALADGVRSYGAPLAIVLDDAHVLSDEACWRSLEHFVGHLPAGARVVMTTRADPPLRLGRLRAARMLGEVRARELAFTFDEARELLVEHEGIALADADVELLVERTEGWPAGLYLAALWLRELDDPVAGVQAFHGDHRHVVDYLTGEVLDVLDGETRTFLLETSILGVFDGAMCDAVLGRTDSASRLEALERENGFLVALDSSREAYRYHHLFGELLQLELTRTMPDVPARLHLRASHVCLERGRVVDALDHAAAADEPALVASILEREHRTLLRAGRVGTLVRWCEWLPDETLVEHPAIPLAAAIAVGLAGQDAHLRHRLTQIGEQARADRPDVWSPYHEAALGLVRVAWVDADLGRAVALGRGVLPTAARVDELEVPVLACVALLLYLNGEHDEARATADTALDRPEAPQRPHGKVIARSTLALVAAAAGDHSAAVGHADRAVAFALGAGVDQSASGGIARVARAVALVEAGDLQGAEREAVEGERLRRCPDPEVGHVHALLVLADIRARRGRLDAAAADLGLANRRLAAFAHAGTVLPALAATVEKRLRRARAVAAAVVERPSDAELNVLRLLSTDLSQREIGAQLYLSLNTVKTHMRAIYRKLGVSSRDGAVERATALGLLDPDRPSP
jgi:ATP/maltotriose-dependent transcriptional regulator MalT